MEVELENNSLRAYFFQNMYLQGIHAGIQSQHTTAEMFVKYLPFEKFESDVLYKWANCHKTTIVLNGGYSADLEEVQTLFMREDNRYPWASFSESGEALNGALTNVGIIVPSAVYTSPDLAYEDGVTLLEYMDDKDFSMFDYKLASLIKSKRLMT